MMSRLFLISLGVIGLVGCTRIEPFAMAVDDNAIYYRECFDVLGVWVKCEVKTKTTNSKPTMQRIQRDIASDGFLDKHSR